MDDIKNIYVTIILILSDAFWFGYCYEKMDWLKKSLFWEWKPGTMAFGIIENAGKETYVPYYRVFVQWPLDGIGIWLVLFNGIMPHTDVLEYVKLAGMLLAWYLMVKEFGYYIVLGQMAVIEKYEQDKTDVYWLTRGYFAGKWVFKGGYTLGKFWMSFVIGTVILIISNFL